MPSSIPSEAPKGLTPFCVYVRLNIDPFHLLPLLRSTLATRCRVFRWGYIDQHAVCEYIFAHTEIHAGYSFFHGFGRGVCSKASVISDSASLARRNYPVALCRLVWRWEPPWICCIRRAVKGGFMQFLEWGTEPISRMV